MTALRVITVARKPLSEGSVAQNVLVHGTGGVNIDGCRVGYLSEGDQASAIPQGRATAKVGALAGGVQNQRDRTEFAADNTKGRWPANLLLAHRPGCAWVGEKQVKNKGGVPQTETVKDSPVRLVLQKKRTGFTHYFDPETGTETVDAWECEPGCPVAALDEQSGVVPTGNWCRQTDGAHPFGDAVGSPYETWQTVEEQPGGASRFFKQVKP